MSSPPPPPPPPLPLRTPLSVVGVLLVLPCLVILLSCAASAETVAPAPLYIKCNSPFCSPFQSPPSFPFGVAPGCGHPAFQIRCTPDNRSQITIAGFSFSILDFRGDSLLVSPCLGSRIDGVCVAGSSTAFPPSQIDLSSSPFLFSDESCSRLAMIHPCRSELLRLPPNCSAIVGGGRTGVWRSCLLSWPLHLLKGCNTSHYQRPNNSRDDRQGCESEMYASMADFLRSGIWIEWRLTEDVYSSCSNCWKQNGACGFNLSDPTHSFLCLAPDVTLPRIPESGHNHRVNRVVLFTTALFALTCLAVLALSAAIIFRRGFGSGGNRCDDGENAVTAFFRRHQLHLQPPVFTYDQLCSSTGGFDPKCKIGDGGFGSVYLAQLEDGRSVAVKRLHRKHPSAATNSFCNEILILSSIHHPNLVRLHGYCCDPRGLLLVYDYVPNGTLADHLHGPRRLQNKSSLAWPLRVSVALQTALALEYLHFSVKPPVVHRDITSSNIFIEKDMRIKVGDFGLSRLLCLPDPGSCSSGSASEYVCTGPQGTPGYLDPDYHLSFRLTEKSDVYSFGVVLLELVTGMKAMDLRRDKQEISLAHMVVSKIQVGDLQQVVDPVLLRHGPMMGTVESMAELAFRCVAGEKDDRPNARELVTELKRIQNRIQEDSKGS
ncbi:unnamed protein product [Spirodela intermedia]|uniref:Protein kinase domain-containing protein n=1 Tax=Spirodela intermedia TaxID=51605 RepID=A0A7I8KC79_SPIIN|nr:unnamed protein product [Spirodela intermedia]